MIHQRQLHRAKVQIYFSNSIIKVPGINIKGLDDSVFDVLNVLLFLHSMVSHPHPQLANLEPDKAVKKSTLHLILHLSADNTSSTVKWWVDAAICCM
jgi:hypothetical protein